MSLLYVVVCLFMFSLFICYSFWFKLSKMEAALVALEGPDPIDTESDAGASPASPASNEADASPASPSAASNVDPMDAAFAALQGRRYKQGGAPLSNMARSSRIKKADKSHITCLTEMANRRSTRKVEVISTETWGSQGHPRPMSMNVP